MEILPNVLVECYAYVSLCSGQSIRHSSIYLYYQASFIMLMLQNFNSPKQQYEELLEICHRIGSFSQNKSVYR